MENYVALLRGINVNGKNIIKMEALRETLSSIGYKNVKTYIQSGNIVFNYQKKDIETIEKHIQNQIKTNFSLDISVFILIQSDFKKSIIENPLLNISNLNETYFHITFLHEIPNEVFVDDLIKNKSNTELIIWDKKCLFLYCLDGYGNTKLSNKYIENKLKIKATTRNWKTCKTLLEFSENIK